MNDSTARFARYVEALPPWRRRLLGGLINHSLVIAAILKALDPSEEIGRRFACAVAQRIDDRVNRFLDDRA